MLSLKNLVFISVFYIFLTVTRLGHVTASADFLHVCHTVPRRGPASSQESCPLVSRSRGGTSPRWQLCWCRWGGSRTQKLARLNTAGHAWDWVRDRLSCDTHTTTHEPRIYVVNVSYCLLALSINKQHLNTSKHTGKYNLVETFKKLI